MCKRERTPQGGEECEAEGDPEQHVLGAGPPAGDEADTEDQHAEVGDDASELGGGGIVALRPDEGEAGPDDEAEEQADDDQGGSRAAGNRQGLDRDAEQHDPPDGDAHLVAWDRVITAVFEAEMDDRFGRQGAPGRDPANCSPPSSGYARRNGQGISTGCGRRSPLQFR